MKKVLPVLLMAASATGAYSQTKTLQFSKNPEHRARVIEQATKGNEKTTSAKYRVSAASSYMFDEQDMVIKLEDSGVYRYSNGRGSSFSLEELYLEDYGMESTLHYDTAYKAGESGGSVGETGRYIATYNSNNKKETFTIGNKVAQGYQNQSQQKVVFNANGDVTTHTMYQWNSSQNNWEAMFAVDYKYNSQNQLVSDSSYYIVNSTPSSVTHYTYDGNGNVKTTLFLAWQGTSLDTAMRTTNEYYSNNKVKTSVEELYNSMNDWENSSFDSLGYTSAGDLEYRLYREWDDANGEWINSEQESRVFINGKATELTFETWDDVSNKWEIMIEGEAQYNTNGDPYLLIAYGYAGGIKLPFPVAVQNLYYEEYYNVGVDKTPKANLLKVYPNPATNFVTVELNDTKAAQIQLTNINGQVVRSINADNQQKVQVSLSGLTPGNYILTVNDNQGAPARQMISVQ